MLKEKKLTHFNEEGRGRMVDVGEKEITQRMARAQARVYMKPETLAMVQAGKMAKGDVLGVSQTAGVMGAKQTPFLIPMCHPLPISGVDLHFQVEEETNSILIEATVRVESKTGVEMEALTAASIAALTIYDMCKAMDREMEIGDVCLLEKMGGKSGHYCRRRREDR